MLLAAPSTATPFAARSVLVTDARGRDRVLTVVKAAWSVPVGGSPVLADEPCEINRQPVFFEERALGSIRLPSDLAPEKPGTDVLLSGHAKHPAAYPDAKWVDVTLAVEAETTRLRKSLRVFGPRRWIEQGGMLVPSAPEAYRETPLRWEWAYGGSTDARNPIGRGADVAKRAEELECPRIELADAAALGPAGFGPIAAHWEPRRSRSGSAAVEDLAPHPPSDRDPRHYCSAPDDQWLADPLRGDETFVVTGVHAHQAWTFALPLLRPAVSWTIRGRTESVVPHLDTVLLDADDQTVILSWRVSFPAPRNSSDLESVAVDRAGGRAARSAGEQPEATFPA
jgi:hypothetical protein